jgi:type I restriction enzyme, S subunit
MRAVIVQAKPYPKYKPSGVEWLGDVPEHWDVKSAKHLVSIPITDGPHETPEFIDSGVPFASVDSVWDGRVHLESMRGYISLEAHWEYSKKYRPQRNDIFIVKSGSTTGKVAIVDFEDEFNVWSPLAAVRCDLKIAFPRFVFYAMSSEYFQGLIRVSWTFGTQPNIGMNVISGLTVLLPPLLEQQAIADFLDDKTAVLDKLTAKKRELLERLQEQRTALISRTVTRGLPEAEARAAGVDVISRFKPSGVEWLGDVPEHWEVTRLGFLVQKIGSGKTPRGGAEFYQSEGVMLIRSQNVHDDGLRLADVVYIDDETDDEMSGTRVKPNDVLLNITGASLGRCCVAPADFSRANVNQHVCIIRLVSRVASPNFIQRVLTSLTVQAQIFASENGSSREGLNFVQIRDFTLACPPLLEQQAIADYLDRETRRIDHLIARVEAALDKLAEYRAALITAAVTGEIDVRSGGSNPIGEA